MRCYIFDVDGTLTAPRKHIDSNFKTQFLNWAKDKDLYIATGSDFVKTKQQLPQEVLNVFKGIFCCMGNELRNSTGTIAFKSNFMIPDDLNEDLERILVNSKYPIKTGTHVEFRTGMVNFSTVGRNASHAQRLEYTNWDSIHKERQSIADYINVNYPDLEASVGGSISIDIIEKGKDKGQVVSWLVDEGYKDIVFFGDRCVPGGNDWGIVRELEKSNIKNQWFNVEGPSYILPLLNVYK